jgi:hypothetical protein
MIEAIIRIGARFQVDADFQTRIDIVFRHRRSAATAKPIYFSFAGVIVAGPSPTICSK